MYNVCSCIYIIIHRHANVCKEEKLSSFPIVTLLFTICRGEKRHIVNSSCFIHGKIWVAFFHVTPQDAICCYRFCIHTDSSNEGEGRLYLLPFLYLFLFCVCELQNLIYRLQLNGGLNFWMRTCVWLCLCANEHLQLAQFDVQIWTKIEFWLWGNGPQLCLTRSWLILCALDLRVAWIDLSCWLGISQN